MSLTGTSHILVRSDDRRRHARQKVSSITYVEFGDDNGGILLNVGADGLALQAVAKLNPGQELTLRFGLINDEDAITVEGTVIWLGPTRKEAGICFTGISERTSDAIEKWLAAQEAERISAEWKAAAASEPEAEPGKNEIHLLPQLPVVSEVLKNGPVELNERPIPLIAATSERHLSDSLLDHAKKRAKTSPVFGTYVPSMMPTRLLQYPKEQPKPDDSMANAPDATQDAKQPIVRLFRSIPPESSNDAGDQVQVVPNPVDNERVSQQPLEPALSHSPAAAVSSAQPNMKLQSISELSAEQAHRRTIQISAVVAACVGILLLLFMTANIGRHTVGDISTAPTRTQNVSSTSPVTVTENSGASSGVSITMRAGPGSEIARTQSTRELQSNASTPAVTGTIANSDQSTAPMQITPQIVQQGPDSWWLDALRQTFFGGQDAPKLDPALASVLVWADQRTGFYYCDNGPYFVKPERVSLLTQGEALQSGFQPKLGTYCY